MKYKHKPTEIEAEQWNPGKAEPDEESKSKSKDKEAKPDQAKLDRERILKGVQHSADGDYIITPHGNAIYLHPGDYIITDHGGYLAVKAGEFERDYEPAEESKEKK